MNDRFPAILVCLTLLLLVSVGRVGAQNRTTVTLAFEDNEDLRLRAEKHVSRFLTELNRASYFDTQPEFPQGAVTQAATSDVRKRWRNGRFRCPETALHRRLTRAGDDEALEVPSIPVLVETERGTNTRRKARLVLDARARVDGFIFEDEEDPRPKTGTIVIRSQPTDATVMAAIDGGTRTSTPARFDEVPANTYAFTLRKDGYQTVEDTAFTVRENQVTEHTVTLAPTTGRLDVRGVPTDATVLLDGEERPLRRPVDVTSGTHTVRISKEDFATWDTTLTVPPGTMTTVSPHLRRKKSPLTLESTPPGATVYVDGDSVGATPLNTSLDAGRTHTVRVTKTGHVPSPPSRIVANPDSGIKKHVALTRLETQSTAEHAKLVNVQARRSDGVVDLRYDLIGESGETYRVDLALRGPDGSLRSFPADTLRGDFGPDLAPGPDKLIRWRSTLPSGSSVRLQLSEPSHGNRLLYVLGGAGAVTATVAAILLGGGGDGEGTSFPAPPGLPN